MSAAELIVAVVQQLMVGMWQDSIYALLEPLCTMTQAVLVYDVASRESFDELGQWLAEAADFGAGGIPMAVCANKVRDACAYFS